MAVAAVLAAIMPAGAAVAAPEGDRSGGAGGSAAVAAAPDPGTGTLYWKAPDGLVPLPSLGIDADLRVTGLLVQGTVRQTFRNTSGRTIEALYVFPLPEHASVDSFEMRLRDRVIRSEVRERAAARAEYEAAKKEGRQAALLEFARKGLFRTSIAGIGPDDEVAVTLRYFDEAEYLDGVSSLVLPLTWTARYTPGPEPAGAEPAAGAASAAGTVAASAEAAGAEAEAATSSPMPSSRAPRTCGADETFVPASNAAAPAMAVRVALEPGTALAGIRSSSHPITVRRNDGHPGDGRRNDPGGAPYLVATRPGAPADRDFRLEWTDTASARPHGSVFLEERDDGVYGLALILPPAAGTAGDAGLPTGTLFVVDVSGSMEGPSLAQAKLALLAALDALRPEDSFNILKFATESAPFRADFQPATPSRLDEARAWVRSLGTEGGTEILAALHHALRLMESAPPRAARRIVLITDGAVDADEAAIAAITSGLGETRLHTVGIGPAPNRSLMRSLARRGRGACEFIGSPDEVAPRLEAFLERLRRPVLTDLVLDWDGIAPVDLRPERLPDLHAGEPLVLSLRLAAGAPTAGVTLRGWSAAGPFSTRLEIAPDAPRGAGLGARWARARIEDLTDGLASGADESQVRGQVVPLAIAFGLVTPYTSRVAIEERVSYQGTPTAVAAANAFPGSAGDTIELPRGGTLDRLFLACGLMLLLAGALFAAAWRWSA